MALVLGAMDGARAGLVLKLIPEAQRPQILRRLATLEAVSPEVLREVGNALSIELRASVSTGGMRRFDGKGAAVELLRRTPAAQQSEAVQEIEKDDPELAAELRTKLFTFQDRDQPLRPRRADVPARGGHQPAGRGPEGRRRHRSRTRS